MIRPHVSSHIVYLCDGLPNDEFPYSLFAFLPLPGLTIADFLTFAFVVSSLVCWVDFFFVRRSLFQSICCRFLDANNEQKADAHDRCHCHFVFEPSVRTIVENPNRLNSIFFFIVFPIEILLCPFRMCQARVPVLRIRLAAVLTSDFIHHSEMIESKRDRRVDGVLIHCVQLVQQIERTTSHSNEGKSENALHVTLFRCTVAKIG